MSTAVDRRRQILDAAVGVFAREGFHTCRVSDIASEAQVAYGLVYHYFPSKEAILDTLFTDRWQLLMQAIADTDAESGSAREKLYQVAAFILDSYRCDPDLTKVIIVEVTRAANTFGRNHFAEMVSAYEATATIVRAAQEQGVFRRDVRALFAAQAFYGMVEQVLTQWIFQEQLVAPDELDRAKGEITAMICTGLECR